MSSVQVGIRIPPRLYERLVIHAAKVGLSKSEVIITALAQYLDCAEDVPLVQRVAEIERRIEILETQSS